MSEHVDFFSVSECDEMSEAVRVLETGTRPAGRQNERVKEGEPFDSQTMSVSRLLSSVSLTERAKNERSKLGKCRVYIDEHFT